MRKILLAKPRGFCAGVVRAIQTVEKALAMWGAPIYVKHHIVHNRHVIHRLEQMGACFIEDLTQLPPGSRVIYSAHGIPPSVREEVARLGLVEIDATCGLVTKVHSAAKRFAKQGYHIILIGHRSHVEMVGTQGQAPEVTTIVENCEEAQSLTFPVTQKLCYLTQTTLSMEDVQEVVQVLQSKYPHIETLPTSSICYATTNRQMALKAICRECDCILVIGDRASSNSNRLVEVSRHQGTPAYLVEDAESMMFSWISGASTIGMTAGASTPESIVQDILERLRSWGEFDLEEVQSIQEEVVFGLPMFPQ